MDVTRIPRFTFGLDAIATARGSGVEWSPRVGPAAQSVPLPDCDVLAGWSFTFASPAASVEIDAALDYAYAALASIQSILVSGVTGTGTGSLNVEYMAGDPSGGMPAWTLVNAGIRWIDGYWHLVLSGVSQFIMKRPAVLPSVTPADWEIHPDGSATGLPALSFEDYGALPVIASGSSNRDFEGEVLSVGQTHALCVQCTAGRVAFAWGTGLVVLSAGQQFPLGLPGGEGAWFLGPAFVLVSCVAASAASVTLAATEA